MKSFADLHIKTSSDKKLFTCPQTSITDIVNCEVVILDYITNVTTKHGDGRCLVLFEHNGQRGKFFTNASKIKEVLTQVTPEDLPFSTVIKATSIGKGKVYELT